jgi:hypothetical protein
MVKEVSGIPNGPLPPCAPVHKVQHFNDRISHVSPDPVNIQYFWPKALGKYKWNKQATVLFASEYHNLYQEGSILYNGDVLPYNFAISVKEFGKKIRIRLQQTQIHYRNANRPQNDDPHNTDLSFPTPSELASLQLKGNRFHHRGAKCYKQLLFFFSSSLTCNCLMLFILLILT